MWSAILPGPCARCSSHLRLPSRLPDSCNPNPLSRDGLRTLMIAYVFWYSARADVDLRKFDEGMRAFHRGLAHHPPPGFASSRSFRTGPLPWAERATSYEDWYLVEDFTGLGRLNERAAAGGHAEAHDHVAEYSEQGAGSVYALEAGEASLVPLVMYWFDRPEELTTPTFINETRALVKAAGATLWRRQLSLGPAREYCVHSMARLDLPFPAHEVTPQSLIWPV